jgi:hypothetical protein
VERSSNAPVTLASATRELLSVLSTPRCAKPSMLKFQVQSTSPSSSPVHLSPGFLLDRFDSASEGWIFPSSVTESQFPAIEIGLGSAGSEQRFSVYPGDLAFSEASPG